MDLFMKTSIFGAALADVYKNEEDRELPALPKMDLGGDAVRNARCCGANYP